MNVKWKYNSNGNLTIHHQGLEKIFEKIGLFQIKQTIKRYLDQLESQNMQEKPKTENNSHGKSKTQQQKKQHQKKVIRVGLNIAGNKPPPRNIRKNKK